MSLFDYIEFEDISIIDKSLTPFQDCIWQTKSLECKLNTYKIRTIPETKTKPRTKFKPNFFSKIKSFNTKSFNTKSLDTKSLDNYSLIDHPSQYNSNFLASLYKVQKPNLNLSEIKNLSFDELIEYHSNKNTYKSKINKRRFSLSNLFNPLFDEDNQVESSVNSSSISNLAPNLTLTSTSTSTSTLDYKLVPYLYEGYLNIHYFESIKPDFYNCIEVGLFLFEGQILKTRIEEFEINQKRK